MLRLALGALLLVCAGCASAPPSLRVGVAVNEQVVLEASGEGPTLDVVCVPGEGVSELRSERGDVGFTVSWFASEVEYKALLWLVGEGNELNASWRERLDSDSPEGEWALKSAVWSLSPERALRLRLEPNGALTPE